MDLMDQKHFQFVLAANFLQDLINRAKDMGLIKLPIPMQNEQDFSITSSVLLVGIPGKRFKCKRGVRQRDPLSPLLFVLAADFLQNLINRAKDDTLIIMEGDSRQLFFLKTILQNFSDSIRLKVNYNK